MTIPLIHSIMYIMKLPNPIEKLHEIFIRLDTENEQYLFAATGYFLFLSLVVLWLKHDDQYIKFHAKHGFVLFVLLILAFPFWSLPRVFGLSFGWVPNLLVMLLMLYGVLKALSGQYYRMPVITPLTEKFKF